MRIAIITDIHEHNKNLRKTFNRIEKQDCNEIICLGDIVGFSVPHYNFLKNRNASKCVNLIRDKCSFSVVGNHDLFAIKKTPKNSPFKFPVDWFKKSIYEQRSLSEKTAWLYLNELRPVVKQEDIEYLKSLNEYKIKNYSKGNILFSHYLYPDLTGSVKTSLYNDSFIESHFEFMSKNQCKISFVGHSHSKRLKSITKNGILTIDKKREIDIGETQIFLVPPIVRNNYNYGSYVIIDLYKNTIEHF